MSQLIKENRFDGSFFNADANVFEETLIKHSKHTLDYYCNKIYTPSRGQRSYTKPEFGYPYLGNSEMLAQNPFFVCNYTSKTKAIASDSKDSNSFFKECMILTGRVGAIGDIAYVPKHWENKRAIGSDNIIRIEVSPEFKSGFVYAFLASKFGRQAFLKHATGGVQPFITDKMVGSIPIPDLPLSKMMEIDELMKESLKYRDEAYNVMMEAVSLLEKSIGIDYNVGATEFVKTFSISEILSNNMRFDSAYNIKRHYLKKQASQNIRTAKLGSFSKEIFVGSRGKRLYVKEGKPFLSSSDMMLFNPLKYANKISCKTPGIERMVAQKDDILISRSGTVGNVVIVGEQLNGAAVSEHALRLRVDASKIDPNYVFCYLITVHGRHVLESLPYGSVIITLGEEYVADIDLPIVPIETQKEVSKLIRESTEKQDLAARKERIATFLVEQEIEKWSN